MIVGHLVSFDILLCELWCVLLLASPYNDAAAIVSRSPEELFYGAPVFGFIASAVGMFDALQTSESRLPHSHCLSPTTCTPYKYTSTHLSSQFSAA